MAVLTIVQAAGSAGVAFVPVSAAGGGDKFANDGSVLLYVLNGDASPINVTLDAQTYKGEPIADRVVAVAAGAARWIGPLERDVFNDTDGNVNVAYSAVTSVTVAVLKPNR